MSDLYTIARINGGAIAWSDEQVAYIIDKYLNENYTLKQLGKEFSCNYGTIRNLLNKHHIQSRGKKQGFPRDEFYFNEINSIDKAYWLGFLYADGCVHSNDNSISINITDLEHVQKFQTALKATNHKITITQDNRFKNAKPLYQFSIRDEQLHKDLIKWGCVPQKSLLIEKIPNIPRDFVSHFLRGYFDGDGCISISKEGYLRFRLCCYRDELLKDIDTFLKKKYNNTSSLSKDSNRQMYELSISTFYAKDIFKDMYSLNSLHLERKYQKYLEYKTQETLTSN